MLGRLLVGMLKGLLVGSLLGFGLLKLGLSSPLPAVVAYSSAAAAGIILGLVAGKPVWAKDGKVEAAAKAVAGGLLAAGLMAAVRTWLMIQLPFTVGSLAPEGATVGGFALTALGLIGTVLGAFFDVDNSPEPGETSPDARRRLPERSRRRTAEAAAVPEPEDEDEHARDRRLRR